MRPTKQRGQNFVIDANTVRRIVRASGVGPDDVVLEVGPGLGSLTLALLETVARGRRRRDRPGARRGAARHHRGVRPGPGGPLRGRRGRRAAGRRDPGPPPTALVANLPYNVSVPVLLHLLALLPSLRARAGHGAGRGRRPARRAARLARSTASRRSRPPGTPTYAGPGRSAATCSGRRPTSTPGWSPGRAASRRPIAATREQVFAVVDAAFAQRRKTLRSALERAGRLGRGAPRPPWRTPASTRWRAARRSACEEFARIAEAPGAEGASVSRAVSVTVRAPAKINLSLGRRRPPRRRLPPAGHRLPGDRPVRRGHASPTPAT